MPEKLTLPALWGDCIACHARSVTPSEPQTSTTIGPALSRQAIDELKAIYHRKYGRELPDREAWAMGHRLVRLFAILTRPPRTPPDDEVRTPSRLTRRATGA